MYLIDGHNLIGQLQDISLDDPQDEAKLTVAVRRYCMRARAKADIIFDNGLPGGFSKELSNSDVKVYFAPSGVQADTLLMRRVREMNMAHSGVIMVTSDNRINSLCFAYGVETLSSEEFALMLGFRPVEREPLDEANPRGKKRIEIIYDKDPNPNVSVQEIAYWMPIFKQRLKEAQQEREAEREAHRKKMQTIRSTPKPQPKPDGKLPRKSRF